jgi:mRNA-degrading endonuclease RelE of RelBE toxin-antitoxin system
MNFDVKTTKIFERQAKRLITKYPYLKEEIKLLITELRKEPVKGIPIGYDCFKIRVAISSKGKGKSAGARIITHILYKNKTVLLISIYDKSEVQSLTSKEILSLLKYIS